MPISSLVTNAVKQQLKNAATSKLLYGIKPEEIDVLPEGRVPPSVGQWFITISLENLRNVSGETNYRGSRVGFQVHVIRRIRDIPNDRFGLIYEQEQELAAIHESIKLQIESSSMLTTLLTLNANEKLSDAQVPDPDSLASRPVRYNITKTFVYHSTRLNPTRLYAGFFLAKSDHNDRKISGYKTYSTFSSPVFYEVYNPLTGECGAYDPNSL